MILDRGLRLLRQTGTGTGIVGQNSDDPRQGTKTCSRTADIQYLHPGRTAMILDRGLRLVRTTCWLMQIATRQNSDDPRQGTKT